MILFQGIYWKVVCYFVGIVYLGYCVQLLFIFNLLRRNKVFEFLEFYSDVNQLFFILYVIVWQCGEVFYISEFQILIIENQGGERGGVIWKVEFRVRNSVRQEVGRIGFKFWKELDMKLEFRFSLMVVLIARKEICDGDNSVLNVLLGIFVFVLTY